MIFGCQSSIIHTSVDIHIDIQAWISKQGHFATDIRKQQISMNGYPCFMDTILPLSTLLWISIWMSLDFYGYPCIDLLSHGFSIQGKEQQRVPTFSYGYRGRTPPSIVDDLHIGTVLQKPFDSTHVLVLYSKMQGGVVVVSFSIHTTT